MRVGSLVQLRPRHATESGWVGLVVKIAPWRGPGATRSVAHIQFLSDPDRIHTYDAKDLEVVSL
jgi:hypothetical protein